MRRSRRKARLDKRSWRAESYSKERCMSSNKKLEHVAQAMSFRARQHPDQRCQNHVGEHERCLALSCIVEHVLACYEKAFRSGTQKDE